MRTLYLLRILGALLFVFGIAKVVALANRDLAPLAVDEVIGLTNVVIMPVVGGIEIGIGIVCFFAPTTIAAQFGLVSLTASILAYRAARLLLGIGAPCPCAGSIFKRWKWANENSNWIVLGMLVLMVFASINIIVRYFRNGTESPNITA